MKWYKVCVESYLSNNSDYKEYDIYYYETDTYEKAEAYANKCITNWNKQSDGVIYNIYNITPHN